MMYKTCINKYKGVFHGGVFLGGIFPGEIHRGRIWPEGIFHGGVLLVPKHLVKYVHETDILTKITKFKGLMSKTFKNRII